ncbi:MAG: MBL fold metallo-hydrolase [Eubacteriales bacterium]|jgi:hydroxyacylglutathione hydrolase
MQLSKAHEITEFSPGVWIINEFGLDAVFLIEGTEKALLIDTGTGVGDLKAVVEGLTQKPITVALTHGHVDHAGGIRQFDEVYVHPADFEMTRNLSIERRKEYAFRFPAITGTRPYREEDIGNYGRELPKLLPLEDNFIFYLGGRKVSVVHTPGHTYGSCVFIDDKSRVLFSGDAANGNLLLGLGKMEDVDYTSAPVETAWKGLIRLKARQPEFDYNFNGHVGPKPAKPQPSRTLDDCIACMEGIMKGTLKKEKRPSPYAPVEREGAFYGVVMISFDENNIFETK